VVGGFVEKEYVASINEQVGQLHPAQLSTREAGEFAIEYGVLESAQQPGENIAGFAIGRPFVVELISDHSHSNGHSGRWITYLGQHSYAQSSSVRDTTGVNRRTTKHPEQSRLAPAVTSDNSDSVRLIEPEGNVVKNGLVRESHSHVLEVDVVAGHCRKHAM
jgi:hypothetical protein